MRTTLGTIRGRRVGSVDQFSGIRYATAARFEPPVPASGWDGDLDATRPGAQCPQVFGILDQALGMTEAPVAEDCLYLNVFAPIPHVGDGAPSISCPVIVWIHGGGFTSGSATMPWYDGGALVERGNVIVVTLNYRLGAFGFTGRTNAGIRDQIAALEWVRDHIGAFGGDPADVTIVGESAGGAAVIALLATPAADGLFHRAMAMSPSINQLRSAARGEESLQQLLAASGAESLDELRSCSADDLLAAQNRLVADRDTWFTAFSPGVDGDLFCDDIVEAAARSTVPLVIGTTRDEMNLFAAFDPATAAIDESQLRRRARLVPGAVGAGAEGTEVDVVLDRYRAARPGATPGQLATAIQTDETFRVPARRLAEARSRLGTATWMYWFTWATPAFGGVLGSCHALDIPFLFHQLELPSVRQFTGDARDRCAVADRFAGALLELVHHGSPGWAPYDETRRVTMRFDVDSGPVIDPEPELRELW